MEFQKDKAIYLQIADYICENILSKKWVENDRIPSVRELAIELEVNPNTVMRTVTFLQEKGIIFNQRGIGYFVAVNSYENTLNLKKSDFIQSELPRIFKTMRLLGLSLDDIKQYAIQPVNN
ncbi:MAG: GntR family transcriptional regulator [Candidatus Neomarinimicrobiota bacterium]